MITRSAFVALLVCASLVVVGCRRAAQTPRPAVVSAPDVVEEPPPRSAQQIITAALDVRRRLRDRGESDPFASWGAAEIQSVLAALVDPTVALELATVDPYDSDGDGGPRVESGHRKLSSTIVRDPATRATLSRSLIDAVERSNGMAAMCFNPRHMIAYRHRDTNVSWIICLECLQVQLWIDGRFFESLTIDPTRIAPRLPPSERGNEGESPFVR